MVEILPSCRISNNDTASSEAAVRVGGNENDVDLMSEQNA